MIGFDEESSLKEVTFFIYQNGCRALSVIACNPPVVDMDYCDFDLIANVVVYQLLFINKAVTNQPVNNL